MVLILGVAEEEVVEIDGRHAAAQNWPVEQDRIVDAGVGALQLHASVQNERQ